ncbi:MAG: NADH-quinone oxidoreductase subunit C [Nitrososphaerales archaeon]
MSLTTERERALLDKIKAKFEDVIKEKYVKPKRIRIDVSPQKIFEVASFLKALGFNQVASVAGTDYPSSNEMEVVYHIVAIDNELRDIVFALGERVSRDNPIVPSLTDVWKSASYHEQETYEMLGIKFEGHPRLERLLLPEDWADIPPLRKEFKLPGRE